MVFAERKRIRLERDCYELKGAIFHLVIRTAESRPLFHDPDIASDTLNGILTGSVARESDLYAVCLMPDHVHLLQGVTHVNLVDLIRRWKTFTTNRLHQFGISGDVWQRSFYDHGMRNGEDLVTTAHYIVANPLRAGIVDESSIYPYAWCKL